MRFKAGLNTSSTFTKLVASLQSLGAVAWLRLSEHDVRFTIIPEQGTQVWATLQIDSLFDTYSIQSAAEASTINLEVPLAPLHRALKSAQSASNPSIRLTKKDDVPYLCVTMTHTAATRVDAFAGEDTRDSFGRERETAVSLNVPIRVIPAGQVAGLYEPRSREPDVHIILPPLSQLKAVSDRFTKLASATAAGAAAAKGSKAPKLELSATAHGSLRISLRTDSLNIASTWRGLSNAELDPASIPGGEEGVAQHPSTLMKEIGEEDPRGWATVRVDARDWGRVLSVGRLGGRVIACFVNGFALVLYVYIDAAAESGEEGGCLAYFIGGYAAG